MMVEGGVFKVFNKAVSAGARKEFAGLNKVYLA
jgi:hypothetical protein